MTTSYSLKGLPVIIQVSFSYNNQDWEPIRTWQLCSPRASIHSVLHVREPQTRFWCRVPVQSLEPTLRHSGFETETSGAEVKVRGEIFIVLVYMVLSVLSIQFPYSGVPFWRDFIFLLHPQVHRYRMLIKDSVVPVHFQFRVESIWCLGGADHYWCSVCFWSACPSCRENDCVRNRDPPACGLIQTF